MTSRACAPRAGGKTAPDVPCSPLRDHLPWSHKGGAHPPHLTGHHRPGLPGNPDHRL